MIKVYGVHGSPFVRKVLIALDIKGIEYEIVPQMPFSGDKEYLNINPLGKIPTLVDDKLTLGDSKVICRYLESAYPEIPLYPDDVAERAMADWYEDLCGGPSRLNRSRMKNWCQKSSIRSCRRCWITSKARFQQTALSLVTSPSLTSVLSARLSMRLTQNMRSIPVNGQNWQG